MLKDCPNTKPLCKDWESVWVFFVFVFCFFCVCLFISPGIHGNLCKNTTLHKLKTHRLQWPHMIKNTVFSGGEGMGQFGIVTKYTNDFSLKQSKTANPRKRVDYYFPSYHISTLQQQQQKQPQGIHMKRKVWPRFTGENKLTETIPEESWTL